MIGAVLALAILLMRMWVPESPRWLITHNRADEAREIVEGIEAQFREHGVTVPDDARQAAAAARPRAHEDARSRSTRCSARIASARWSGSSLMTAQAFFYNAIFFTYALVLTDFYGVPGDHIGWYRAAVRARAIFSDRSCSASSST